MSRFPPVEFAATQALLLADRAAAGQLTAQAQARRMTCAWELPPIMVGLV